MMKYFSILLIAAFFTAGTNNWGHDLAAAKQQAAQEHKLILLNFSGSDWCGPCIRLHKEIFDSPVFSDYAKDHLVLLNADFPRLKKNQLPKELQKTNDALADQYNSQGSFPYTVLLDEKGGVLKSWDGFPGVSAEAFTEQVKAASGSH